MRFAFVTDKSDTHVERFSSLFQTFGYDYCFLKLHYLSDSLPQIRIDGHDLIGWPQIAAKLDSRFDIVITAPIDTVSIYLSLCRSKHIAISFATDIMVTLSQSDVLYHSFIESILDYSFILTDNYATENALISMGLPSSRILRLPWGPEELKVEIKQRSNFNIPEDRAVIFYPRTLNLHYDPIIFFQSLKIVSVKYPKVLAVFIEHGHMLKEIQKYIAEHNLENNVLSMPFQTPEAVTQILRISDALVVSPRTDGTSVTVMDAMSLGIPVITSLTSGSSEWIIDGITGWNFPTGNAFALADSINNALDQSPRKFHVLENAKRLVGARAGWTRTSLILKRKFKTLASIG